MTNSFLFLYLNTGGGHYSCAKAVAEQIGDREVLLHNVIEKNIPSKIVLERGYKLSQDVKGSYKGIYEIHKNNMVKNLSQKFITSANRKKLQSFILEKNPKKIVVFHFMLITLVEDILKKLDLDIPVTTIVTDPFTGHPWWFGGKSCDYIVFSTRMKHFAIRQGIDLERITVCNYIFSKSFEKPLLEKEKTVFLRKNSFEQKKTLLFVGGGLGLPKSDKLLSKLSKSSYQIIVVCGHNKLLLKKCLLIKKLHKRNDFHVLGFVPFVRELIGVSDIIISKGGPATIHEILAMGKIPIINEFIWGQERGNVDFIIENNVGFYEPKVGTLCKLLHLLETNESFMQDINNNIEVLQLRSGSKEVAQVLLE